METIFEKLGGTYRQEGEYLLPDIEPSESPQIGIWGKRRLRYLRASKKVLYTAMLMDGILKGHLEETDQSANEMFGLLVAQLKAQEGVTEEMKASNQLEWVQRMNSIRNRAEEIVYKALIYA